MLYRVRLSRRNFSVQRRQISDIFERRCDNADLVESQQLPFESSEKAVMVSRSEDGPVAAENEEVQNINEFLTPEVMRFMPIAE